PGPAPKTTRSYCSAMDSLDSLLVFRRRVFPSDARGPSDGPAGSPIRETRLSSVKHFTARGAAGEDDGIRMFRQDRRAAENPRGPPRQFLSFGGPESVAGHVHPFAVQTHPSKKSEG